MSTPTVTPLNIIYIDPDGLEWDLTDLSMSKGYVCSAISGIEGFPTSMQTIPMLDGTSIVNYYLPQPGSIVLAVLVSAPDGGDEDKYYAMLDKVVRAFFNRRQELPASGSLIIQRPDGSTRKTDVFTTSGLDTPEVGIHNTLYTLTLQTPDPYWSDVATQALVFRVNTSSGILPILPVQVGTSYVLGDAIITTNGNAFSWPTWTITGPGIPTLKNLTTGRQWSLNTSIPAGNVIQVVTKPGSQMAVNVTTSTNIWDQLVLSSLRDLWALMSGSNRINISMSGSTPATAVVVNWVDRWNRA